MHGRGRQAEPAADLHRCESVSPPKPTIRRTTCGGVLDALGLDHQPCPADGALAPVLMQQTFGTANNQVAHLDPQGVVAPDGFTCLPNPWPFPQS